jgi:transposase
MFLRGHLRRKDGKEHRYFSIEESRRLSSGKTVQRRVLYLGEINDSQQAAWRKSLEVFDEAGQRYTTRSLFPEDRPVPVDAVDSLQVKLSEMQLRRPRAFGNCWLGCELWRQLRLDEFWRQKLPAGREAVHWAQVLELLAVNRLIDPGSEFRLHRQWFEQSAMDQLLGVDFVVAAKDRLYRCLDRLLPHRQELFTHLRRRWENLFEARFDLLLYDLTSTYVEGEAELIPKARHGYSRDGRFDCKQVVIALVVTPEGFPLAYEVMAGNTSDRNSLRIFLEKIETMYGKARRVWMMDRGIPSEELLAEMRAPEREMFYLVGTPRGKIRQYEKKWLALPWNKVRDSVEVKLFADGEEMHVLAKSEGRQAKEMAIRRRKLARLLWKLRAMRRSLPERDALLMRIGAAKSEAGRAYGFVKVTLPTDQEEVTRQSFQFRLDKKKLQAAERLDGHYLLRTNLTGEDPAVLWDRYIQLTQIEEAFKCLKSELGIRPIHHQVESRVEAHILVAFLGYCLMVTLKQRLQAHAPGLTPRAVLDKLAAIQMLDVWLPITDGRWLVMPRHTEPEAEAALLLHKLKLTLPAQPPPRITTATISQEAISMAL